MTTPNTPSPAGTPAPAAPAVVASIPRSLDLRRELVECGDRLDSARAASYARSASVLLRHLHTAAPIPLVVSGPDAGRRGRYHVDCHAVSTAMEATYPPASTETIDDAACGVALLLAVDILQAHYLRRAVEYDGFDFFFSPQGAGNPMDPFEGDIGVEVSGIRRQTATNTIQRRARTKAKQARSRWNLPNSYAIVVEFSLPTAVIVAA